MKQICFIINPISGTRDKKRLPDMIAPLLDKDACETSFIFTEHSGQAADISAKKAAEGVDIVVAVGGDGTVNEVARGITHTKTALGIIPCGSGNGLARHLGIPFDLKQDITLINECRTELLDYGTVNDIPFFCTCGMGFDAFISMKFAEAGKRGALSYVQNILEEMVRYKPETYLLENETGTKRYKAFLMACGNASQYGNNAYIAPKATMSDGMMDVTIIEPFNAIETPTLAIDLMNKTIDKNSKIKTFRCRRLHVVRQKPGAIHFDGEPMITGTDIDIRIVPRGINIIVNTRAAAREPNRVIELFTDAIEGLNAGITQMTDDIDRRRRQLKVINRKIVKKMNV